MSAPEKNQQLASDVARIKRLAIQHFKRVHWTLGASVVGCVVLGLVAWFIQKPTDAEDIGMLVLLCSLPFFFVCILGRILLPTLSAKCPRCGCDWNIESDNDTQRWLAWHSCPRCGLRMNDDIG